MKNTTKIFTALFISAVISGGVYYTQFTPEQREIRQLEKNVQLVRDYDDEEAWKALEQVPPERLRLLAEKGNAAAQYQLGVYYDSKDKKALAETWFKKAAEQHFAMAYRQLALIEARKHDNQQKYIEFLKQAYQLGDKGSQMLLAVNALEEDDKLTALMLVEEVAQQDYAWAQAQLGQWYFDGNVASRDWKKAFYWFNKAYANSKIYHQDGVYQVARGQSRPIIIQRELAILYLLGIGTAKNEDKAVALLAEIPEIAQEEDIATLSDLKIYIVGMKDKIDDPLIQYKIEQLEEEMLASKEPKILILLGEKESDQSKAKVYFGEACDAGSQEGCDKYRELNEKGVK
ncbi:tetratricopeptide repeat protein [Avibacterium paragallinarum]|uniref:Sel1 repeat n=1 Tax=Avibacterium paragallinarum TaxID=728 RepID=A0A380X330_AVIPA|nr:SEL1-like repeat protein [Avibacterium paragallinarum]SUU96971.1 Sel1 repeat [Avibacterium paragallinarum]SUU97651.1 Sel1 repeat [Avibacterium paragallinarum]